MEHSLLNLSCIKVTVNLVMVKHHTSITNGIRLLDTRKPCSVYTYNHYVLAGWVGTLRNYNPNTEPSHMVSIHLTLFIRVKHTREG